jgi:predicted histidine transporter YuiF (NhaC family)
MLSFRAMADSTLQNPTPQFGTAEYVGSPGGEHCQFCHQPIAGNYFRANGAMTCPGCAEKMRGELARDTHAAFVRASLFGVGAAILGMILYATFAIVTGIVIGYAALAVGWLVGKAMIKGSNGVGGRRYQLVAVLLTYAAVSTAAIPVWIHFAGEHKKSRQTQTTKSEQGSESGSDLGTQEEQPTKARPSFVSIMGTLVLLGLASPFLEFSSNPLGAMIGLVILFVGMQFAWKMTGAQPLQIFGPFENSPQGPH